MVRLSRQKSRESDQIAPQHKSGRGLARAPSDSSRGAARPREIPPDGRAAAPVRCPRRLQEIPLARQDRPVFADAGSSSDRARPRPRRACATATDRISASPAASRDRMKPCKRAPRASRGARQRCARAAAARSRPSLQPRRNDSAVQRGDGRRCRARSLPTARARRAQTAVPALPSSARQPRGGLRLRIGSAQIERLGRARIFVGRDGEPPDPDDVGSAPLVDDDRRLSRAAARLRRAAQRRCR